jgi:hypothetical protein
MDNGALGGSNHGFLLFAAMQAGHPSCIVFFQHIGREQKIEIGCHLVPVQRANTGNMCGEMCIANGENQFVAELYAQTLWRALVRPIPEALYYFTHCAWAIHPEQSHCLAVSFRSSSDLILDTLRRHFHQISSVACWSINFSQSTTYHRI